MHRCLWHRVYTCSLRSVQTVQEETLRENEAPSSRLCQPASR